MASDPDTHNENAHPKLQTQEPKTNATQQLPTSCLSTPDYTELLFWKHEGDMVTIIVVSRKYFPGEEERKKE